MHDRSIKSNSITKPIIKFHNINNFFFINLIFVLLFMCSCSALFS